MNFICKIELDDIFPDIWREFHFHSEVTFHQLHKIIQVVMGWEDYHLYEFHVNEEVIGLLDPTFADMDDREMLNARRETIQEHLDDKGAVFRYIYDLGDYWSHTITLLQIDSSVASGPLPLCLDGARQCPQEDVGGVGGHEQMLEALRTPDHPERESYESWAKEGHDPEYFSAEEVNLELKIQKNKFIPKAFVQLSNDKKPVKLTKTVLNKHLKQLSSKELIELVKACYSASKEMEKFLAAKILGEEAAESLFQEYRKKVEDEFFPKRGHGKLRLQEAKQAISEFQRLTGSVKYTLELKIIYVEMGVAFTLTYGDIDERFYYSMESMYADIIDIVNKDETAELFDEYEERIEDIVIETAGRIGWGFPDTLADMYSQLRWI